jgi:hypothetical protein
MASQKGQSFLDALLRNVDKRIAEALRGYKPKMDSVEGVLSPDHGGSGSGSGGGSTSGTAGGDLSGTYPNPSVVALQGIPVNPATPADSDVLTYSGGSNQWYGATWTSGTGTVGPVGPQGPPGPPGPPGGTGGVGVAPPAHSGQFLVSLDGASWVPVYLVTDSAAGLLFDDYGAIIVSA